MVQLAASHHDDRKKGTTRSMELMLLAQGATSTNSSKHKVVMGAVPCAPAAAAPASSRLIWVVVGDFAAW